MDISSPEKNVGGMVGTVDSLLVWRDHLGQDRIEMHE